MAAQEDKYDGILEQILRDYGGYEGFFNNVFAFLRRKTNFFTNVEQGEQIASKMAKIQAELYFETQRKEEERRNKIQNKKATAEIPKTVNQDLIEVNKALEKAPKEDATNLKLAPNKGNGSSTESYYWTQTLEEVSVHIPIDNNDTKRTLTIDLGISKCFISRKDGSRVFIDDEWCHKIHVDESSWVIVDDSKGKAIQLTVLKWKNESIWWDCLVKGEPKIDTQKVNPEPGKLSDLDGEARTTVEKMMFDMHQKQRGLPTSDELEKKEKLKEFMKAHPELDFSKATFG